MIRHPAGSAADRRITHRPVASRRGTAQRADGPVLDPLSHGLLDYLVVTALCVQPHLSGWSFELTAALSLLALMKLAYCLCTDYPLGFCRLVSVRGHGNLDRLLGCSLLAGALLAQWEPLPVRLALALVGLLEVAASYMTAPTAPREGVQPAAGRAACPRQVTVRRERG